MDKRCKERKRKNQAIRCAYSGKMINKNDEVILVKNLVAYARKLGYLISNVKFVFMFLFLFLLISNVSAISDSHSYDLVRDSNYIDSLRNYDSVVSKNGFTKYYYPEDKNLKIIDSQKVLLDVKLKSEYFERVLAGSSRPIAEFDLVDFSVDDFFDSIVFFDINNNYKILDKDYVLKYSDGNDWIEFNSLSDLPSKKSHVAIFTSVSVGEKFEWVISKNGFDVLEWAVVLGTNAGFVTEAPTGNLIGGTQIDKHTQGHFDTAPSDGTVSEIGFWVDSLTENAEAQVGLYADNSNNPGSLIWNSSIEVMTSGTDFWYSFEVPDIEISNGVKYWIMVFVNDTSTTSYTDIDALPGHKFGYFTDVDGITDPFEGFGWSGEYVASFYAVYGAPDSNPNITVIPDDEIITYGNYWDGVYFDAEDDVGIDYWWINDSRFTINQSGFLNMTNLLSAGEYQILVSVNDTIGQEDSEVYTLTINKASSVVYAYIQNLRNNYFTDLEGDLSVDLNGTLITGVGDIYMYLDDVLINSGSSPLYNLSEFSEIGTYVFKVNVSESQNYTSAYESFVIDISEYADTSVHWFDLDFDFFTGIIVLILFVSVCLLIYVRQVVFAGFILIILGFGLLFSGFTFVLSILFIAGGVVCLFIK